MGRFWMLSPETRAEIRDGMRDILPAAIAAVPIGLLFGALCAGKGLSTAEVALMSALVCAGAAQFAAIEMWTHPIPATAILLSTLLVNARNVLMSVSLAPKTELFRPLQKVVGFYPLSDENWALSERRSAERPLTPAYFLTMGLVLWANWVAWTTLGTAAGALLGDPRRLGADFAFTALFIGLIASFWRGPRTAITIVASAAVSVIVHLLVGPPWHVAAGAVAGIAAAYSVAIREPAT
jgi:4-azaleucine resistance transporter AzlC